VELGASIFVKANKNMMRAAKEFNLTLNKFDDDDNEVGIWDGERFDVKVGNNATLEESNSSILSGL
jgi:prenylcysteine oxidase/farnesylcysteine lyase